MGFLILRYAYMHSHSKIEFYRNGKFGKLCLKWGRNGAKNYENFLEQSQNVLQETEKVLIIADINPSAVSSCFRMIYEIAKEAKNKEVEVSIVIANQELIDTAELTIFNNFVAIFLNEDEALNSMEISKKDYYPLISERPDPNPPKAA
jgi:hypothetical protein